MSGRFDFNEERKTLLIRSVFYLIAGNFIRKGYIRSDTVDFLAGIVVYFGMLAWGWIEKNSTDVVMLAVRLIHAKEKEMKRSITGETIVIDTQNPKAPDIKTVQNGEDTQ